VRDHIGQLTTHAVALALSGCAVAPAEYGADEVVDDLELPMIGEHRPYMVNESVDHLLGWRRPATRRQQITA
jgi:hypothetical protein